jgi:hypothetical protein
MAGAKRPDAKASALRAWGALNPRPHAVTDPLFVGPGFFDARDLVQVKYEMLRRVQADGQSVRAAALAFGFSRPSFYNPLEARPTVRQPAIFPRGRGRFPRRALLQRVRHHARGLRQPPVAHHPRPQAHRVAHLALGVAAPLAGFPV